MKGSCVKVLCAEARAFMIEHYFGRFSRKTVKERHENKFPDLVMPNKSTIKRIMDRLQTECVSKPAQTGPDM